MVRILDGSAVDRLLSPELALASMRDLFTLSADPSTVGLARVDLDTPVGWLRVLPGFIQPLGVFGFKTLHRTDGVGMRYVIYVHDLGDGELRGIVDALSVTNLRTGAVSALAADHLAAPEVAVAALVGTGPIARGQAVMLDLVRPAGELRVFARTPENRRRFLAEMRDVISSELVETDSLDEAVGDAGLVTLATKADAPILFPHHLRPGMHVNSVGPASRNRQEVAPAAFVHFDRFVCDAVRLVMNEAGDAFQAAQLGFDVERATELSAVAAGSAPGRTDDSEVTLFKSVGTGLQDLMVATRLLEAAAQASIGETLDDFVSVKPLPHG